jgi:hypothetical protein
MEMVSEPAKRRNRPLHSICEDRLLRKKLQPDREDSAVFQRSCRFAPPML